MDTELDQNGRRYKCGPNWIPNWIFDEPLFQPCCKAHDIMWTNKQGKFRSDVALLRCCWKKADSETGWWRVRAKTQAVVMFLVLITNPLAYIMYWWPRKLGSQYHD